MTTGTSNIPRTDGVSALRHSDNCVSIGARLYLTAINGAMMQVDWRKIAISLTDRPLGPKDPKRGVLSANCLFSTMGATCFARERSGAALPY